MYLLYWLIEPKSLLPSEATNTSLPSILGTSSQSILSSQSVSSWLNALRRTVAGVVLVLAPAADKGLSGAPGLRYIPLQRSS